jgi:hypothetical protein
MTGRMVQIGSDTFKSVDEDLRQISLTHLNRFKRNNTWSGQLIRHVKSLEGRRLFDSIKPVRMVSKDFEPLDASSSFTVIRDGRSGCKRGHHSRIIGIRPY